MWTCRRGASASGCGLAQTRDGERLVAVLVKHLVPEFESSPIDDLHLVLLMKDILRTLRQ
jgi:hypothetical protein